MDHCEKGPRGGTKVRLGQRHASKARSQYRVALRSVASNLEELIAEGKYRVVTPEQAIALIEETGSLHLAPLCGGVPLAEAWQSLKLFEDTVQPYL